jgi:hypothetical protein
MAPHPVTRGIRRRKAVPCPRAPMRGHLQHLLACVLPEAALRRYLNLDERANTLTVAGRSTIFMITTASSWWAAERLAGAPARNWSGS